MPNSSAPILSVTGDTRSGNTLDCSTGAIILREGAAAVGSSLASRERRQHVVVRHVGPVDSRPRVDSGPGLGPLPPPSAFVARRRAEPALERAQEARRARSLRLSAHAAYGGFAVGASVAAVAGIFVDRADFLIAAVASALAGALMLGLWQASCRNRR